MTHNVVGESCFQGDRGLLDVIMILLVEENVVRGAVRGSRLGEGEGAMVRICGGLSVDGN